MTPDAILDMLEPLVRQYLQGDKPDAPVIVVRIPAGLLVLQRSSGAHLLIQVSGAELCLT
jgi:hypothetical protein